MIYLIDGNQLELKFIDTDQNKLENSNDIFHTLRLSDSINILNNDQLNDQTLNFNPVKIQKIISLKENIYITSNNSGSNYVLTIKENSDQLAVLERIKNYNKSKSNDKIELLELMNNEFLYILDSAKSLVDFNYFAYAESFESNTTYFEESNDFFFDYDSLISFFDFNNQSITTDQIQFNNYLQSINNYVLLLLVPLSGFVLILNENSKLQFYNFRRFFSFIAIFILLSSVIITPLSISSSYWGIAYAEEFKNSDNIDSIKSLNNTNPETLQVDSGNVTLPIVLSTNSTSTLNNATTTDSFSLSDTIVLSTNSTSTLNNATTTDSFSLSDTINITVMRSIPEAIFSIQFDSNNTDSSIFNATLNETLQLDGKGDYLKIDNVTSTNELSELTISAWTKPDYTEGSQEFTVISKENQFVMSINNKIKPQKVATFSIFDGIKWTSVESSNTIDEKWTHLGAIFNGTSISIFVNGNLSSTTILPEQIILGVDGELTTASIDTISSDEEIVIGGYLDTKKGIKNISNQFSGEIDDINLYNLVLEKQQITNIYQEKQGYYNSLNTEEIDLNALLDEIIAEQTNSTLNKISFIDSLSITDKINIIAYQQTNTTSLQPILSNILEQGLIVSPILVSSGTNYLIN